MAMRLFRTSIICLVVLFLGSCDVLQYIFGSVFPSTLTLVKAQADLSGKIDEGFGSSFNVRVVETGGYGYVVVAGNTPKTGNSMFFYDLNLNRKLTLTNSTLTGTGVMADGNGRIIAGGTLLNADLTNTGLGSPAVTNNGNGGSDGFVVSDAGVLYQITNIYCGGSNTLNYSVNGTQYISQALSFSPSLSKLQVDAVFDDGVPSGKVVLVISQSGGEDNVKRYFVTIPKTDFTAGTIQNNLIDSAYYWNNLERDTLGFADGSIFAFDRGFSRYVRINPADASLQSSFYSSVKPQDVRFAYRVSGDSFYGFDKKTRILTKYTAWW